MHGIGIIIIYLISNIILEKINNLGDDVMKQHKIYITTFINFSSFIGISLLKYAFHS